MSEKHVKVTVKNGAVDIADGGGLKFDPAKGTRTIFWELGGTEGWFFPKNHPGKPAFTWVDSPDDGIFSDPVICADDRTLVMDDYHFNLASKGDFVYMLRVARVISGGGYEYLTSTYDQFRQIRRADKMGIRTINNPVIINKGP